MKQYTKDEVMKMIEGVIAVHGKDNRDAIIQTLEQMAISDVGLTVFFAMHGYNVIRASVEAMDNTIH